MRNSKFIGSSFDFSSLASLLGSLIDRKSNMMTLLIGRLRAKHNISFGYQDAYFTQVYSRDKRLALFDIVRLKSQALAAETLIIATRPRPVDAARMLVLVNIYTVMGSRRPFRRRWPTTPSSYATFTQINTRRISWGAILPSIFIWWFGRHFIENDYIIFSFPSSFFMQFMLAPSQDAWSSDIRRICYFYYHLHTFVRVTYDITLHFLAFSLVLPRLPYHWFTYLCLLKSLKRIIFLILKFLMHSFIFRYSSVSFIYSLAGNFQASLWFQYCYFWHIDECSEHNKKSLETSPYFTTPWWVAKALINFLTWL